MASLPPESVAMAEVSEVNLHPNEKSPTHVVIKFNVPGISQSLEKKYPFAIDEKSALRKDLHSILQRELKAEELQNGVESSELQKKKFAAVILHRAGPGGKIQLAMGPLFTVEKLNEVVAALS